MKQNGSPKNNSPNKINNSSNLKTNQKQAETSSIRAQVGSLVKYDTKFLVSTTLSNKKLIEELEDNKDPDTFLRNLINKRSIDEKGEKSAYEDYSVKDALNNILPPLKTYEDDQLWVQYVSCTPVTKAEVLNLQEGLDRRLQTMQARETGICPIREELYNECFDELIRQVTINCLERGILLMRIKKEIEMTINSYQTLYESAIAYGIRTRLLAEENKEKMSDTCKNIEDECDFLSKRIEDLEKEIDRKTNADLIERQDANKAHDELVNDYRRRNQALKDDIKSKMSAFLK